MNNSIFSLSLNLSLLISISISVSLSLSHSLSFSLSLSLSLSISLSLSLPLSDRHSLWTSKLLTIPLVMLLHVTLASVLRFVWLIAALRY